MLTAVMLISVGCIAQSNSREERDVSGFTGVGFGLAGNVYVKVGSGYDVTLEGNSNFLEDVETFVRNDKLIIRRQGHFRLFNNERINVYITMPELKSLSISGSGKAIVESDLKTDRLDLSVSGSGRIELPSLRADELKCSISGSGDIAINKGKIGKAGLSISGSGSYIGEDAEIDEFDAGISGSGSCSCYVTGSLEASISGSGNVIYSGSPRINVRSSGSGRVRSR